MASSLKSEEKNRSFIAVGKIISAHGLEGAVKVLPLTDLPERLFNLARVFLQSESRHIDQAPPLTQLDIMRVRPHQKLFIFYFKQITDRTGAEALNKHLLTIPKEEALPLPEDCYYPSDLLGFNIYLESGEHLGVISQIFSTGQDILEILTPEGKTFLIPFVKDLVPVVDIKKRLMQVRWLEGLFDL